jgi:two-component system, OmpR family, heavy metal sensor histidine kinase CusS
VTAPRSLRARLTLTFGAMALAAVGLSASALALLVEHAVWAPLDAGLGEEATTLVGLIDLPTAELLETVREIGMEADLGPGKFVRVASADGHTIARWKRVPPVVGRRSPHPLDKITFATVGREPRIHRVVWAPAENGARIVVGVRATQQVRLVRHARVAIAVVGITLILLLVGAVWAIASRVDAEIERLAQELETIEAGSLDRRVSPRHTAEVDRLVAVLNRMLARLEAAVEHLRRFTADAAHELRTPIAALRAHLDVTLSRATTAADLRDGVVDCLGQAERLGRLAEDLLTLSMVESGRPALAARAVPVALDAIVREVAAFLEPVAEEQGRRFTCDVHQPATVSGIPELLKRVVLNLVDNAFRHTPPTSRVGIALDVVDGSARLIVDNDGPGIPAELLPAVFERFRRGSTGTPGAGLGLALVREIVGLHGGHVELESDADRGTVAVVTLPIATG